MAELPSEYLNFFDSLEKLQVRYLLLGGHSINLYGFDRVTKDLDILIDISNENKNRFLKAVEDYGFDTKQLQKEFESKGFEGFLHSQNIVLQVHPGPIEIIGSISGGIDFNKAYDKKNQLNVAGRNIKVISPEDLLKNKQSMKREIDQSDIEFLLKLISKKTNRGKGMGM